MAHVTALCDRNHDLAVVRRTKVTSVDEKAKVKLWLDFRDRVAAGLSDPKSKSGPIERDGAGYGDRTRDIELGKLAFYR